MDELSIIVKAQAFISKVPSLKIPIVLDDYLTLAHAVMTVDSTFGPEESGICMSRDGKHFISVNENETLERQRFSVCHELGHIVLGLPSLHADGFSLYSYARRDPNEVACDIFASELLLPLKHFKHRLSDLEIGFESVDSLAEDFEASTTCTGSRFAAHNPLHCAFVISNKGLVKYASRSTPLRDLGAFIKPGWALPVGSQSELVRSGKKGDGATEIASDLWFQDWKKPGVLLEEARHLKKWDQTLTLLWFEEFSDNTHEDVAPDSDEEERLPELDGQLHFQKRFKRR